ncbi:hypothetical protein H9660_16060 [Clostridium sp. Sa3CUN1]|uniref:Uncharacterized protein n=1 Tax=Clostridium gallinarum TaxID=2762246 RepID=A0ABR8Q886_9CLOT|nr:hypothetical protein [Clostridium gallinarum]MBD7916643.1 hypothetical protein [Clostridium gallinarum]
MKKSLFLAIAGVLLAFSMVSALGNREKIYEKRENFDTPEKAIAKFIGYINKYDYIKNDNGYYTIPSRDFLESISKRYRLYCGEEGWNRTIYETVPILFSYDLEEVEYNSLINIKEKYEDSFKKISNYSRDENPRVFKLVGYGSYNDPEKSEIREDGTIENINDVNEIPVIIYLIVVDEGEGYVIDFYNFSYQ